MALCRPQCHMQRLAWPTCFWAKRRRRRRRRSRSTSAADSWMGAGADAAWLLLERSSAWGVAATESPARAQSRHILMWFQAKGAGKVSADSEAPLWSASCQPTSTC